MSSAPSPDLPGFPLSRQPDIGSAHRPQFRISSSARQLSADHGPECAGNAKADSRYACRMLGLVLSTLAFFLASFFIKRWLDDMGIPKGMTRSLVIFVAAAALSYGVAIVVDLIIA